MQKMKLEDFVSETIKQVINGVASSQKYAEEVGAKVNPLFGNIVGDRLINEGMAGRPDNSIIQEMNFDIEVTTTEGTKSKGGLGVFVGAIGAGVQGQTGQTTNSVGKITFKVPISFPTQK